jgi:hypothetical protein
MRWTRRRGIGRVCVFSMITRFDFVESDVAHGRKVSRSGAMGSVRKCLSRECDDVIFSDMCCSIRLGMSESVETERRLLLVLRLSSDPGGAP